MTEQAEQGQPAPDEGDDLHGSSQSDSPGGSARGAGGPPVSTNAPVGEPDRQQPAEAEPDWETALALHAQWLDESGPQPPDLVRTGRRLRLIGRDLRAVSWPGRRLVDITAMECDLAGADLREAILAGALLEGSSLRGADLGGANLGGAKLSKAILAGAVLRGANLNKSECLNAVLTGADAHGARFGGAELDDADARGGVFTEADFDSAYLKDTDLRGADLRRADLREAIVHGAKLAGADLRGARIGPNTLIYGLRPDPDGDRLLGPDAARTWLTTATQPHNTTTT